MNKQAIARKHGVDQSRIVVVEQKTSGTATLCLFVFLAIMTFYAPFIAIPVMVLFFGLKLVDELFTLLTTIDFWLWLVAVVAVGILMFTLVAGNVV